MVKNTGPRCDPWGTPEIVYTPERNPWTETNRDLFFIDDWIHRKNDPHMNSVYYNKVDCKASILKETMFFRIDKSTAFT